MFEKILEKHPYTHIIENVTTSKINTFRDAPNVSLKIKELLLIVDNYVFMDIYNLLNN